MSIESQEIRISLSKQEIFDIITDSLCELTSDICPNCQSDIGIRRFLDDKEIQEWIDERFEFLRNHR